MKTTHNNDITKVVFRIFKGGEVIALFPQYKEGNGMILSYMHYGQHSAATPALVYGTKPATPEQYAPLLQELQNIGYLCRVCKRITR